MENYLGIGSPCAQSIECDYDALCMNGRCLCLEPRYDFKGRCIVRKEVGANFLNISLFIIYFFNRTQVFAKFI